MEPLEDLKLLQNTLASQPDFETHYYQDANFLRVTKYCSSKGLRYLPNFHLVFSALDNGNLCMRVLTFHGRTLSTIFFKLTDAQVPQKVTEALEDIRDNAKVCKGVERHKNLPQDCIVEYFNDNLTARSVNCAFLILENEECCEECQRIVGIKQEVDIDRIEALPDCKKRLGKEEVADLLLIDSLKNEEVAMEEQTYEEYNGDDDWHPYNDYEPAEIIPIKRKRGRPPKDPSLKVQKVPKQRGRPRLVYPPHESHLARKPILKKEETNDQQTSNKFSCQICLKVYKSENALNHHLLSHEKYFDTNGNIDCPLCKKSVERLSLTNHFATEHSSPEQSLTCCLACLEVIPHTNQGEQLRQHIFQCHQQKHVCEICGKVFNYIKNLECHVKTKHFPDSKEFFCDRCGKGFCHEIALHKHVQVACAMEEWKCELCSKIFGCRKKLRFHLMVHCEDKPYACKLCAYRSYKADNLSLHVKKTHHLKGVRGDFLTLADTLKTQTEFIEKYIAKARIK